MKSAQALTATKVSSKIGRTESLKLLKHALEILHILPCQELCFRMMVVAMSSSLGKLTVVKFIHL